MGKQKPFKNQDCAISLQFHIDYMRADSAIGFLKFIGRCENFAHIELFYIVIVISTQNLKFIAFIFQEL